LFQMSSAERKTLLVAGAAAGMTAIFGTPIAAVMLGVELLLFEWKPRSFIPVAAAAAVAHTNRPLFFETGPLFQTHFHLALPWWGIFACALIGIVAGLQSGLLTTLLYKLEDAFERLPVHWMWWPAIGGIAIGIGGLIEPRALGVGYDLIDGFLNDKFLATTVLVVLLVKSAIWLCALASGTSGGVLAPLLIFGGAMGWLLGLILPGGEPGFWALLGMAAMMGGTMRAPLTGTFFAVEVTGDFGQIVPVFVATVTAYAVTVLLLKRSILTEKIARRGQHITREYGVSPFESARVHEVMVTNVDTLPASMTVQEASAFFASEAARHRLYPVIDNDRILIGVVTRADALEWQRKTELSSQTLADAVSDTSTPVGHQDDSVAFITDMMIATDCGRIPIVTHDGKLCGLVSRKDLLQLRGQINGSETERKSFLRAAEAG